MSSESKFNVVKQEVVIGSSDTCDIRIEEGVVSRRHCVVYQIQSGFLIEDLESRNGIYIDGIRVNGKAAFNGCEKITLGRTVPVPWEKVVGFFGRQENTESIPNRFVTIGRLSSNDIVIPSVDVSGRHARVVYEQDKVFIEDLGSRNGTYLNTKDRSVTREQLRRADIIFFSNTQFAASDLFDDKFSCEHSSDSGDKLKTELGEVPAVAAGVLDLSGKQGSFILGRSSLSDFQINFPMVSLKHAKITILDNLICVKDLGSSNGTFINSVRVSGTKVLNPGDCVALGSAWFVLSKDGRSFVPQADRGDMILEARDVGVQVAKGKRILEGVSLAILPGELVGLMGPSGAGKSTLISALNGYQAPTSGDVSINGRDLYEQYDEFRGVIGYVPQDDIMHADLTVSEALYYSAKLRLPTDYSDEEIYQRIDKVLDDLGLKGTEYTRIGNAERRGISGGQRKRVNVAMELLTDPPLLFLDEPTSGLSSEDALSLMRLMRKLADSGKTVVLTIHQPSLEVYRQMDNLIVVGKDNDPSASGQLVYSGPAYPDAITFFEPQSKDLGSPDAVLRGLSTQSVEVWTRWYRSSQHYERFVKNRLQKRSRHDYNKLHKRKKVGGISQYASLVKRGIAVKLKDTLNTGVLLLQAPLIALLIGLVFGPTLAGDVTVENFTNVARATATTMFLLGISALWFGCSNSARDIVSEAAIYRRERMVGLAIPSFIAAKVTILALLCFFQCGVLLFVVGWLGSLSASWLYLYFAIFIASLVGVAIGLLVSAAAHTGEVAAGVLPLVILPMVILGGVLLPLYDLPKSPVPMNLVAGVMPSRWAFESLLLPEASARPRLESGMNPPAIIEASEETQDDSETQHDMAEAFFEQENRGSRTEAFPIFVMFAQIIACLACVGQMLLRRDTA